LGGKNILLNSKSKKMENSNGDFKVNGSLDVNQNLQVNGNSFIFGGLDITGPFKIAGALSVNQTMSATALRITDANGTPFLDNWMGMASNIEGVTKWLHIGGITDSGARRLALFADRTFISGNLGIGTTSPTTGRLEIHHNSAFNNVHLALRETEAGDWARISFQHYSQKAWHIAGRSDVEPMMNFWHSDHGDVIQMYAPERRVSIHPLWKLTFGNQVRQMIDLWSTEYGLGVQNATLYFRSWDRFYWYKGGVHADNLGIDSGGAKELMSLHGDGNLYLPFGQAFKPGGGGWAHYSDAKLKKKIKSFEGALDKLTQLNGVNFEWKEASVMGSQEGVQTGFVAQEVEKIFPDWVITDRNGIKCISFKGFEALVVEALKELNSKINKINN
jgi:hypothetical protein